MTAAVAGPGPDSESPGPAGKDASIDVTARPTPLNGATRARAGPGGALSTGSHGPTEAFFEGACTGNFTMERLRPELHATFFTLTGSRLAPLKSFA